MTADLQLIGPFAQLLPLTNLPERGAIRDEALTVLPAGGLLVQNGNIVAVNDWETLRQTYPQAIHHPLDGTWVALPAFVDAHTHICFAGSRAMDFAARNAGVSYLDIARAGGGIWSTVQHTRAATQEELATLMLQRLNTLLQQGVTTVEVKSGYGLSVEEELKMLRAIRDAAAKHSVDVVPTCLAAHMTPKDFQGDATDWLHTILRKIVPSVESEHLCQRFDIFIEQSAFQPAQATPFLQALKAKGFP
ncbi:MAG: hypothetical protein R2795_16035 [Saprospiraceae bacterium]